MKILIVDDSPDMRLLLRARASKYFSEIEVANNGQLGYHAFKRFQPDVVLSDLEMPIMNGEQMAERIRQTGAGKSVPIILHTAAPGKCTKSELFNKIVSKSSYEALKAVLEEYSV